MTGKRIYFPDEEPEKEYVELKVWGFGCKSCGEEDHEAVECPNVPYYLSVLSTNFSTSGTRKKDPST